MTDPLVEFLLARNAEDREIALAATPGPWYANLLDAGDGVDDYWEVGTAPDAKDHVDPRGDVVSAGWTSDPAGGATKADAQHIARWDPAHVLAECEAKRRMIEDLVAESAEHWGPRESPEREWEWCPKVRTREFCAHTDLEWGPDAPCECHVEWPDHKRIPLLRYFTLPYVDHPDCREEWLP